MIDVLKRLPFGFILEDVKIKPFTSVKKTIKVPLKSIETNDKNLIFIGTTTGKRKVFINLKDYSENGLRYVLVGQSGSGKSHLSRVIIEEFIDKGRRNIVIDPEGEWYSIKAMAKEKIVVIGGDNGISIGVDPDDEEYELNDESVEKISDVVYRKVEWVLNDKGRTLVFDLSSFIDEDKQPIYALISQILFNMQKEFKKTITFFVDEASLFAPQNEAANAKKLKTGKKLSARTESVRNARRGRKFGLRQGYALQRPANFDKNVLANCTLRFIGRMEDENDFNAIEHLLKRLLDEMIHVPKKDRSKILFNQLQSFKPGQFYMCYKGDIQLIQVKTKTKTKHVGSTPEDDY